MSIAYVLGMVCGALVSIVLIFAVLKWMRKDSGKKLILDERQERARGIGFKYGFFTSIILIVLFSFYAAVAENYAQNTVVIL